MENMVRFSLANCVEPFLQSVSFTTFRHLHYSSVCQCFDSDTDSVSDCELDDL